MTRKNNKDLFLKNTICQEKTFFLRGDFRPFSITFPKEFRFFFFQLDIGLWEVGANRSLIQVIKWWKSEEKKFPWPRRFYTIVEKKCSNLKPLLSISFSQGFRISKKIGHWTLGNGDKKTFKWSEQMKKKMYKNSFCRGDFTPLT